MDLPDHDSSKRIPDAIIFPTKSESILTLALAIIEKHQREGVRSPLKNQIVADLHYKTSHAKAKHDEGMKYFKLMEEAFIERDILIGTHSGNVYSGSTITHILSVFAQALEEYDAKQLAKWGFTVHSI
jgi:hypothetical protein